MKQHFSFTLAFVGGLFLGSGAVAETAVSGAEQTLPIAWQHLDVDGDQFITREEMRITAQNRFRGADLNGDGVIERVEWFESASNLADRTGLERSFAIMDANGSGAIEAHEMRQPPQNRDLFAQMDTDGNDKLSSDELIRVHH